jgi:hypothetical protein
LTEIKAAPAGHVEHAAYARHDHASYTVQAHDTESHDQRAHSSHHPSGLTPKSRMRQKACDAAGRGIVLEVVSHVVAISRHVDEEKLIAALSDRAGAEACKRKCI